MLRTILRRKAGQERGRGWCFFMLVALALLAACPLVVLLAGSLCDASTATTSGFCRWQRGTVDSRVEQAPVGAVGGGTQPQATEQKQPQQQQQQAPDKQQEQEPQQGHGDAHSHDTHGVDDIDMPKSDEDIERIMKYPHVNECNLCQVCVLHSAVAKHPKAQERAKEMAHILEVDDLLTDPKMYVISGAKEKAGRDSSSSSSSSAARSLQEEAGHGRRLHELDTIESNGVLEVHGRNIDISAVAPGNTRAPLRVDLPNCTVCWGCKHTLEPMASGDILFDSYYAHEPGGSPSWLFQVRTNKTKSGWALVKTWCVPVLKVKQRGLAMCSPTKVFTQVKLLLAQQQITANCGLNDIVPRLWIEPLHGVVPGHGFRIDWLALWFDIAEGVSVQNIHEFGKPQIKPAVIIDLFQNKVNHTEVKLAAIFDLLFSQCDRHQQNIFMTEEGQLRIIDNDQVYGSAWRKCGVDSMVVPTTQKYMINHLGFFYVLKYPQADPPTTWVTEPNPLLLLDYRCHVGGNGTIGSDFPPQIRQCLTDLAKMTAEEINWEYGYPALRMADAIRNRSRDMLAQGYEWTLLHGEPTNQAMHRYKIAPSCCNMTHDKGRYRCETPGYKQMSEVPFGNPWHGGDWHGTVGKDTGTYAGGADI